MKGKEALGREGDRFVPVHFAPGIGNRVPDHGAEHAILVGGIAPSETSLHTGVALVGAAILVGYHADHLIPLHLGLERATDAAIGAGRNDAMFGLPMIEDGLFHQCGRRASLNAGAARHTLGVKEILIGAGRNLGLEAPAIDGEGKGALGFLAGPDTARADDAFGGLEGEIRVALVVLHF